MFQPIDIAGGEVTSVDDLSSAASSVVNFDVDAAGINRPRPALTTYAITGLTTDPVIESFKWYNYLILVTRNASTGVRSIWSVNDAVPGTAQARSDATTATQLPGSTRPVFASGERHVYIAGGTTMMRWGPSLAFAEVVTNAPPCTHVAALGGRLVTNIVGSRNDWQWSDVGEGVWTTWPAANTTSADARPDAVVAIYENINQLFVFGESTLQTYQVGSDPTLPYDKTATINLGAAAYYSPVRLDEHFALIDDKIRIVLTDGSTAEPISEAIDKTLRGLTTVADAWGYREELNQYTRLVYNFPTDGITFAYDMRDKKWTERKYYAKPFQSAWPVSSYSYRAKDNWHIAGSTLGGAWRINPNAAYDGSSVPIVCERVTGWQDFGSGKRKRSSCLALSMRRGTAAQGATSGALEFRAQPDDGPWSEWKSIAIGNPGDYSQVQHTYSLNGIFRRRRYHFRYSNTDNTSLVSVADDVTELDS